MNDSFNEMVTTTLKNYRETFVDNIFNAMPLLYWLLRKGKKDVLDGGEQIVIPVMYGKNETVTSYAGGETMDVSKSPGFSAAAFNWKQVGGAITIDGDEWKKNKSSKTRIINLLDARTKQAELSMRDALSKMIFLDGTGNENKDVLGLKAIAADAPSTGILGGINRATYPAWRNYSAEGDKDTTKFDNLIEKMRTMYNSCSKGGDHPDLLLADQSSFEGYEGQLAQYERFTDTKTANGGFENLKFKGAVVMFDEDCPSDAAHGRMYGLNSKYLSFTVHEDADFEPTDFLKPVNADTKTAQILFMGNLVVSNCARQGVIYDIDLV
jgi:hypothetical protein